ncbi:D-alanyl-D-alanine carboxypeptidase family protein [Patescibacteria group bacterium]|nr:D-alanyl-D-alanine carboxypeptidase family protein [Patescibacteria group bacterium]
MSNFQALLLFIVVAGMMIVCHAMFGERSRLPKHTVEEYTQMHCPNCSEKQFERIVNEANDLLAETSSDEYINMNGELIYKPRLELAMKNEFAAECLDSGLSPVRKINGDPMINKHGDVCYMRTPLADAITEANEEMYADTGIEISPSLCWRPNEQQAVLHAIMRPKNGNPELYKACGRPGRSFHNTGLALDVNNWRTSGVYLADLGMIGGCESILVDDDGHYSLGEMTKESGWISGTCQFSPGAANTARKAKKAWNKYWLW